MEDRISMATKRQVTLRFRDEYVRASKKQKGVILDRMCETLGIGRSTARRLLAQAGQHGNGAVPAARERPVFGPVATAAGTGVGVDGYAVWQVFEGDAAAVAARVARLRGAGRL